MKALSAAVGLLLRANVSFEGTLVAFAIFFGVCPVERMSGSFLRGVAGSRDSSFVYQGWFMISVRSSSIEFVLRLMVGLPPEFFTVFLLRSSSAATTSLLSSSVFSGDCC